MCTYPYTHKHTHAKKKKKTEFSAYQSSGQLARGRPKSWYGKERTSPAEEEDVNVADALMKGVSFLLRMLDSANAGENGG